MSETHLIAQIKEYDKVMEEHLSSIGKCELIQIGLFRDLSNQCEHRDPDKAHCRHEELKRAAGSRAYPNGCVIHICPLLK